ncbi:MAG: hypothetical protein ACHP6H_05450, partial [Legionellales bacterium]
LRILIPLSIIVLFFFVLSIALASVPEVFLAIIVIPALYAATALASGYLMVKENLRSMILKTYYGGRYEIPEYQISPRMIHAFGTQTKAQSIRDFYMDALKECDEKEQQFYIKYELGTLSSREIEARKNNFKEKFSLVMEWYDIHTNPDLGSDQVLSIALNRLTLCLERECAFMEEAWNTIDSSLMEQYIAAYVNEVQAFIKVASTKDTTTHPNPSNETSNPWQFFKPANLISLENKNTAEKLINLMVPLVSRPQ